jgi:hypothetical protein
MAGNVANILAKSRRNNTRDGVTGGLLFSDGCFAQVLGGPADMVESAYKRIQGDIRHSDVTVLEAKSITNRDFPNWSMGYAGSTAADHRFGNLALATVFSGHSNNGFVLLKLLKSLMKRETEWLTAVSE